MSWTMFGAVMTIIVVCIVVLLVVIKDLSTNKTVKPNTNYTEKEEYTPQETAKFAKHIKIAALLLVAIILFFSIRAIYGEVVEKKIIQYMTETYVEADSYAILVQKATHYKVSGKPFAKFYFVCVRYEYGTCNTYLVTYDGGEISVRG